MSYHSDFSHTGCNMTRSDWHIHRLSGIGSSDAPAILGVSPWSTPLKVWLTKTGKLQHEPDEEMAHNLKMGLLMEPVIARLYAEETGISLRKPQSIHRHELHDWMIASLDYEHEDGSAIVELKRVNRWETEHGKWGKEYSAEVPHHYWVQVQHQMAVRETAMTRFGVLGPFDQLRIYEVNGDRDFQDLLIEKEALFWDMVKSGTAPEIDWNHSSTAELVKMLFDKVDGADIELPDAACIFAAQFLKVKEQIKELEKQMKANEAQLLAAMGEAKKGKMPGYSVYRDQISRKGYTVEPTTYIRFSVREDKPTTKGEA